MPLLRSSSKPQVQFDVELSNYKLNVGTLIIVHPSVFDKNKSRSSLHSGIECAWTYHIFKFDFCYLVDKASSLTLNWCYYSSVILRQEICAQVASNYLWQAPMSNVHQSSVSSGCNVTCWVSIWTQYVRVLNDATKQIVFKWKCSKSFCIHSSQKVAIDIIVPFESV